MAHLDLIAYAVVVGLWAIGLLALIVGLAYEFRKTGESRPPRRRLLRLTLAVAALVDSLTQPARQVRA